MEPDPPPPEMRPAAKGTGARMQRSIAHGSERAETARGKSYTAKPEFSKEDGNQNATKRKPRSRWLIVALVAATLLASGLVWKQDSLPHWMHPWSAAQQGQTLTLTDSDVDYSATASAQAALAQGHIPPVLAHADAETCRKVLSGEEKLYTKKFLDENKRGIVVHVRVSASGTLLGEDLLTTERRQGTTFPAGPGVPTHFHFTVQEAGPEGVVSCYVNSVTGATSVTRPMAAGESGDLEVVTQ